MDRGVVVALGGEELQGRLDQGIPGALLLALPPAGGRLGEATAGSPPGNGPAASGVSCLTETSIRIMVPGAAHNVSK